MARRDIFLILFARIIRMFSFGAVATILFFHLQAIGMSTDQIGFMFSATVLGDLLLTIPLTTRADRWGRKRVLIVSALLKVLSGFAFLSTDDRILLTVAATIGILTPTGGEIGPFMAVEQAALTSQLKDQSAGVTRLFSVYNFVGYFAQAAGALAAGFIVQQFVQTPEEGYSKIFQVFVLAAVLKVVIYSCLSIEIEVTSEPETARAVELTPLAKPDIESTGTTVNKEDEEQESSKLISKEISTTTPTKIEAAPSVAYENSGFIRFALRASGLKRLETLKLVSIISMLFIVDAFAGGLIMQPIIVAWFEKQYGMSPQWLGALISGMNILSGISALLVIPLARFGPLNVAVFSHLPSNVMLMLVPLMKTAEASAGMILARSTLSQMDVPARQAFVALSVAADERSAAGGITMIVRSVGIILAPLIWTPLMAAPAKSIMFSMPFILAGAIKIVYDLMLYFCFRRLDRAST